MEEITELREDCNMAEKIYERLERISFSRPSGTKEERRAAEILIREIRGIGLEPEVEEFTYLRRYPKEAELRAILEDGSEEAFQVTGVIDAAETPEEGTETEFYYLKSFDEVSLTRVKGKLVLIHDRLSPQEYERLRKAGIAGYLTTSGTVRDTYENSDLETGRFRDNLHDLGAVPAFTIRMIDAVNLLRSRPKKVFFKLRFREEEIHSQNIVVTIEGKKYPDQILVAGAHYDSVPFSLGSWDNGAGAVRILELLEYYKNRIPDRTVKAILFGSEETGLRGSRAFLAAHADLGEQILAMLNVDVGGSILGKEIIFVTASDDTEVWIRQLLKEVGYEAVTTQKLMSSDSASFNDWGIPSISIGQGAPRGGGYMHTRYDNMDLIDEKVLKEEAEFLNTLADRLVNAKVFPIPRFLPEKLQKEVISYFGASQSRLVSHPAKPEEKPLPFHF